MSVQVASGQQLLRQMESAQVQVYRTGLFAYVSINQPPKLSIKRYSEVYVCSLDSLLGGGVRGEHVMELAGQAGTGKTQVWTQVASSDS